MQQMIHARIRQYDNPQNQAAVPYAFIEPLPDGACPFLSQERLCMIQKEYGDAYLCPTCRVFPRSPHTVDGITEVPLTLSCPRQPG